MQPIDAMLMGARGLDLALSAILAATILGWALTRRIDARPRVLGIVAVGGALSLFGTLAAATGFAEAVRNLWLLDSGPLRLYDEARLHRDVAIWIMRAISDVALAACLVWGAWLLLRARSTRV